MPPCMKEMNRNMYREKQARIKSGVPDLSGCYKKLDPSPPRRRGLYSFNRKGELPVYKSLGEDFQNNQSDHKALRYYEKRTGDFVPIKQDKNISRLYNDQDMKGRAVK